MTTVAMGQLGPGNLLSTSQIPISQHYFHDELEIAQTSLNNIEKKKNKESGYRKGNRETESNPDGTHLLCVP